MPSRLRTKRIENFGLTSEPRTHPTLLAGGRQGARRITDSEAAGTAERTERATGLTASFRPLVNVLSERIEGANGLGIVETPSPNVAKA